MKTLQWGLFRTNMKKCVGNILHLHPEALFYSRGLLHTQPQEGSHNPPKGTHILPKEKEETYPVSKTVYVCSWRNQKVGHVVQLYP